MSAAQSTETHAPHVLPVKVYLGIFGALLFLTLLTVGVSYLDLGGPAIAVAMVVAVIKASLVVGYFMHLKFENRFLSLVFIGSLGFLVLFFAIIFIDLSSRGDVLKEQDTFSLQKEKALEKLAAPPAVVPAAVPAAVPATK
ncbi:MAG: cytochrome C oxidase subunit IV family protein [Deltaproteobacteria bacterium]|nr:cytochrome C oxidase subunit IV family protein [Deltaproteobacteria bacterium]